MYTGVNDSVFTIHSSSIKFGLDSSKEAGYELARLGVKKVLLITDRNLVELGLEKNIVNAIESENISVDIYSDIRIEPTDESILRLVEYARNKDYDGFIALGGGSVIDHAKAVNLLTTYPGDIMDYVNKPIGRGKPVAGPLKPLVAIPTTAGSGSENTPVIVLDIEKLRVKTGISHPYIRPSIALVDPKLTITMPPMVTTSTGMDVLTHAAEAYTAKPYYARPKPRNPAERGAYTGSNPITDLLALRAIELVAKNIRRATYNGYDVEARYNMMLACTMASSSFGNAGVHIPHANSYPIAGMVKNYIPPDYNVDHPLVPHGISVALTAPASFKFIASSVPGRLYEIASILGVEPSSDNPRDVGEAVFEAFVTLMEDLGLPLGLREIGYTENDIPMLVEGALQQQRLLAKSPRSIGKKDLEKIFMESLEY